MILIGLAGTNGSGKDTVGYMLAERYNFLFVSVSDLLRDEARRRGLPIEREALRNISAEWRREFGLGVLVDRAIDKFKAANAAGSTYAGVVAIPLRNSGEARHLKDLGGTLIWVDADPHVRYDRIFNRQRSPEDSKTFEQFRAEEAAEMQRSGDEATLNMAEVKTMADISLMNDSTNAEAFKDEAERQLQSVLAPPQVA